MCIPCPLCLFSYCLLPVWIQAQTPETQPVQAEVHDSVRISNLLNLAFDHSRTDLEKAFSFLHQADSIYLSSGLQRLRPNIDYHYAVVHRNKGGFEQALLYTDAFLQEMRKRTDSLEIMKGLNVQTTIHYEQSDLHRLWKVP
ncbi:MAG: hypothetical protein HKN87_04120 [Saprospiraceae bacterium]|nr:hypothetical protein [Saprospiraceae bacterium]